MNVRLLDVQHRPGLIVSLNVLIDGVDVRAAHAQQFDALEAQHVGDHRIHSGLRSVGSTAFTSAP